MILCIVGGEHAFCDTMHVLFFLLMTCYNTFARLHRDFQEVFQTINLLVCETVLVLCYLVTVQCL